MDQSLKEYAERYETDPMAGKNDKYIFISVEESIIVGKVLEKSIIENNKISNFEIMDVINKNNVHYDPMYYGYDIGDIYEEECEFYDNIEGAYYADTFIHSYEENEIKFNWISTWSREIKTMRELPEEITHIRFGAVFNKDVDHLPNWITHITFGDGFRQSVDNLPDSVTHITFGDMFNESVDKLPESVTHITFGCYFDQHVDNLPNGVTYIKFGQYFNQCVDKLPESVTHIVFGDNFSHSINGILKSVEHITFGRWYVREVNDLPPSVTHITFTKGYDLNISRLSDKIKVQFV